MMRKIKLTRANKSILLKALGHSTEKPGRLILKINALPACLLYTSDAADE